MFARALAALALIWLMSSHIIAEGAPAPAGEPNVVLNRHLASLVLPSSPLNPVHPAVLLVLSPRAAVDQQRNSNWLTSPTFIAIASRFTSAERILHYRRGGFDANFWGELNRGRSIRIGYSVRL